MNLRAGQYADENAVSLRRGRDRIRDKPRNTRTLFRWLVREYAQEPPLKMHSGASLEEDGDPAMTGAAKAWLGITLPKGHPPDAPTDWVKVACRTDEDGYYISPMRCALARIPSRDRRDLLSELATNLLFPRAVMDANGIPAWCQNDVLTVSLSILWDTFTDRPIPRSSVAWTEKSDAQRTAEDAA